jgi:hypothetical protein
MVGDVFVDAGVFITAQQNEHSFLFRTRKKPARKIWQA